MHQTIGHLGIFVSGKVATKEHGEFASCIDMIDVMPPGLYEAVITEVDEDTAHPDLIDGHYLLRLEPRTLDDIRAFGANSDEDDRRFATAARVSEINHGLYRTFAQPAVQALASRAIGRAAARDCTRTGCASPPSPTAIPLMQPVKALAEAVRADRQPVVADNPLLTIEQWRRPGSSTCWRAIGQMRDAMTEAVFLGTYGSPVLQALVGPGTADRRRRERRASSATSRARPIEARWQRRARDSASKSAAWPRRVLRALIYVRMPRAQRRRARLRRAAGHPPPCSRPTDRRSLARDQGAVREQYLLLRLDEERAVRAIPRLLPETEAARRAGAGGPARDASARAACCREEGQAPSGADRGAVRRRLPQPLEGGPMADLRHGPPPSDRTTSTIG